MEEVNKVVFTKRLIKLLKESSANCDTAPVDLIDQMVTDKEVIDNVEKMVYENFLILMKHIQVFELIIQNYFKYYGLKPLNKYTIITLMYIIIFILNEYNQKDILVVFSEMKYRFCCHILNYFLVEENLVDVVQAGSKVFDNEHVLGYILHPILNKQTIIKNVSLKLEQILIERYTVFPRPVTKPISPKCTQHKKLNLSPPVNSFVDMTHFKSKEISKGVLKGDSKIKECLEKSHKDNKERAIHLLEFAKQNAFKCAESSAKSSPVNILPKYEFKSTKAPQNKEVTIKSTAASLMREAATFVKDKESEIKRIEALTQSVFDPTKLDALEEEIRKCREQEYLQDIERKHLQGLLTYEESILAKQNLLKLNKEKMEEFKQERVKILEEIEIWKQEEQEKIKILVEKCQNIEKAAREAEQRLQKTKKDNARLIAYESKQLLKQAYEEKQNELARKVQLIQEFRALQQVRCLAVKEFDPTETANFGLLCEMSIAELQERLRLLKIEVQDELERRRKHILENREKQQELIENIKHFIEDTKATRSKPVQKERIQLEQTPDITALRDRLQKARQERLNIQYPSVC